LKTPQLHPSFHACNSSSHHLIHFQTHNLPSAEQTAGVESRDVEVEKRKLECVAPLNALREWFATTINLRILFARGWRRGA
jgi:hypothetical protein